MIQSLMALALRERVVVIGAAILLLLAGLYSFTTSKLTRTRSSR
jgi:Cu/Ag efflux pump CusA